MKALLVLLIILLSGCATRSTLVWEHSQGLNDTQLLSAQKECRQLAHRETRYPYFYHSDLYYPFYRPFYYHDRYYAADFFWHDHYRQMWYQDELSRLYRLCMEAKGWRLVPALPPETTQESKTETDGKTKD